ncbi:MAG TPA: SUMF1/EgtB/PvdO family nonheme iron enzyme [Candidatus Marinimicrobia bacterium]|jgi:hypothetical protein|nr:SUMF1/EgtB/PvdO family nonheme iron enzyme [Candidatus Neomarinimicrobiota bacterium]HJL74147.1 SUMF1/EgtB/PvdO family nonheme iron enzyme [Candidatus Neomarinimicrobiota bacterium]|tara:strand:- start:154 stop:378 length:225 start_codon:yes stop_codon:yes gene_type:complete
MIVRLSLYIFLLIFSGQKTDVLKQMLKIDYGKMVFIPGGIFSMGGNAWEWCADLYHYQSYLIDAKNEVCVKPVG